MGDGTPAVIASTINASVLCHLEDPLELLSLESQPMHVGTTSEHGFVVPGSPAASLVCPTARGAEGTIVWLF